MLGRCLLALCISWSLSAQPKDANYDEAAIPAYTLPALLVSEDGGRVATAQQWRASRRGEILALFEDHVYGHSPETKLEMHAAELERADDALGGKARRKQVRLTFSADRGQSLSVDLLLYLPVESDGPVPLFVGLNFGGNYTISADPAVPVTTSWMRNRADHGNRADPARSGAASSRWPLEEILGRGYGVATAYYGDIDPDFDDGFRNGIHALFPDHQDGDFSSIGAWSWGLSRVLDYLQSDPKVDGAKVALIGHSRLGKTALWAGARDERFALVISNDSGCGGAALSRRRFGETVGRINNSFPHWFSDNFVAYNGNEDELPLDQHMLLALIAPRPLYVASASEDLWADPRGEFLSAMHAGEVYELLGKRGLGLDEPPPVGKAVMHDIGYHKRHGKHDVTLEDWRRYLDFADMHLTGRAAQVR